MHWTRQIKEVVSSQETADTSASDGVYRSRVSSVCFVFVLLVLWFFCVSITLIWLLFPVFMLFLIFLFCFFFFIVARMFRSIG